MAWSSEYSEFHWKQALEIVHLLAIVWQSVGTDGEEVPLAGRGDVRCRKCQVFEEPIMSAVSICVSKWKIYLFPYLITKMVNGFRYYRALESVSIASALSTALTIYPRMYIYILLDTVLATDVNKYSLAFASCQPIWWIHSANGIYTMTGKKRPLNKML